ncbi:Vacuolar protein-sorting-associated protein 28, partial [Tulasnella sp. 408]
VVQSDLAQYRIDYIGYFARIALQDGLCLTWYTSDSGEKVIASILDYRNSKRVDLETDITLTTSPDCCLYNGSLIFHHDKLTNAVVNAYFRITEHLQPVPNNSRPGDVDMISKAPDRSAVLPLHPPDPSSRANQEPNLTWTTIHPTNTPNANTLCGSPSIFATDTMSPKTFDRTPHLSARWMEPRTTLEMLRTGTNLDTLVSRTWIDLEGTTVARDDGFEFLISTTCGLRMLWVSDAEETKSEGSIGEEVLYLIPLLTPDERTKGNAGTRLLRLPIDLFDMLTMDFSDESGTLVIASKSSDTSNQEGTRVKHLALLAAHPILLYRVMAALSLDEEVRLYTTNTEREKYESLATLYGIIISLDYLERAYVRDSISAAQ